MEIRITLTLLLVLIRAQTISGQGAVNGVVRDDSGASVGGAKIILTEESKGLVRESESSRDGSFLFPSLIAGIYSVSVQKEGFSAEQMNALRMEVGELASINVVLHIGEIRTAIRISLHTEAELKAESSTIGSVVDSGQVQQLPLNGRNFLNLGLLTAGVVNVTPANNLFSSNVVPFSE